MDCWRVPEARLPAWTDIRISKLSTEQIRIKKKLLSFPGADRGMNQLTLGLSDPVCSLRLCAVRCLHHPQLMLCWRESLLLQATLAAC